MNANEVRHRPESIWIPVQDAILQLAGIRMVRDHYVWVNGLNRNSTVLDLGANVGDFTAEITKSVGCRCVAVEPNSTNFSRIPSAPTVTLIHGAAWATDGVLTLFMSDDAEAHTVVVPSASEAPGRSESVEAICYQTILRRAGVSAVDLMKLDIEGAEWKFLGAMNDEDLAAIAQITVEFHDFVPSLRDYVETDSIRLRLARIGFVCVTDTRRGTYNTLFLNRNRGATSIRVRGLLALVGFLGKLRRWDNGIRRRLGLPLNG